MREIELTRKTCKLCINHFASSSKMVFRGGAKKLIPPISGELKAL